MDTGRFRAVAARMDALLADRMGDVAVLVEGGRILKGTFASPYQGAEFGGQTKGFTLGGGGSAIVNTSGYSEPTFQMQASDTKGLAKGMRLDVQLPVEAGGGRYEVVALKPDGHGMIDVVLRAA